MEEERKIGIGVGTRLRLRPLVQVSGKKHGGFALRRAVFPQAVADLLDVRSERIDPEVDYLGLGGNRFEPLERLRQRLAVYRIDRTPKQIRTAQNHAF